MKFGPGSIGLRDRLVAEGKLTADFKLTPAGNARVEEILDELQSARVTGNPRAPRVKWRRSAQRKKANAHGS